MRYEYVSLVLKHMRLGITSPQFQYISLYRYAVQVRKHWKQTQQSLSTAETALGKDHKQRCKVQAELQNLTARLQTLEVVEAKLKKWEDRKPVIHHYLGLVGKMAKYAGMPFAPE